MSGLVESTLVIYFSPGTNKYYFEDRCSSQIFEAHFREVELNDSVPLKPVAYLNPDDWTE